MATKPTTALIFTFYILQLVALCSLDFHLWEVLVISCEINDITTMDAVHVIDEEEVSLSNSSLGSDDTSDEEEDELDESVLTSSSFGDGKEMTDDNDTKTSQNNYRKSLQRHHTVAHLPPRPGRDKQQSQHRLGSATFHAFGDEEYGEATKFHQKVSSDAVKSTLSAEVLNQHVLLSQACLELLEERDRYDAMRRLNLRRSLNCTNTNEEEGLSDEEDDEYPLLSLIKGGPLYKLHLKGGIATKKIRSGKDKIKSKLTGSSSVDVVSASTTESSLLTKWKHKYVEVRKGMLSYYSNSTSSLQAKSDLVRKNVTLEVSTSVCRAINLEEGENNHPFETKDTISSSLTPKSGKKKEMSLYAFELVVNGESRVWASGSEAGRQSWIKTINRGMIGRSNAKDDISSKENDPIAQRQLQEFLALSKKRAKNFSMKVRDVSAIGQEFAVLWGTSVEVPVECLFTDERPVKTSHTAPKDELGSFWRNLENLNIELNGKLFRASSLCSPHRVFGFLTRSILERDSSSKQNQSMKISEMQASKHARDVLRSVGKQDEKSCHLRASVGVLCGDENDAVIVEDVEDELPVIKINVTSNKHTLSGVQPNLRADWREWVFVRRKKGKRPKRYFAVLSVGVLCFYKEELPRPHRLKSQLLLVGAEIGTRYQCDPIELSTHTNNEDVSSNSSGYLSSSLSYDTPGSPSMKNPNYIIYIKGREDGTWVKQQLCFTKYETFVTWRDVLVNAIETTSSLPSNVLSFDDANQQSNDEVKANQTIVSRNSIPDKDGVTWIGSAVRPITSTAGDLHRSSRLRNLSVIASRFFESLPPLQIPSPMVGERKYSYTSSLLSSASSIASKQLPRKKLLSRANSSDITPTIEEDAPEKPSTATVEIEVQVSKLHTVFLNHAVGPSMCTIRSTYTESFVCSGGKKGRLEKKRELIKLETLKGKVNVGAFKLAFDSKGAPTRRKTI
jgi:hypothetical protein